jgi:NAD(P)H-dependent flavin oxidoreductase YrpB (nitropropane dioxygenase family)
MRTRVAEMLGVEFPICAFSHCRDVVAAVTNAGGFGVLGAVAHSPQRLENELSWIEEQTGGKPYGVDLLLPPKYVGADEGGIDAKQARTLLPDEHRAFVDDLLARYGVTAPAAEARGSAGGLNISPKGYQPLLDVTFAHNIRLIASALGPPPADLVERAHDQDVLVAALAGTTRHAQRHVAAGVDLIVAQGTEAGGHTGEVSTMVLVPEIVDAVAPVPVLAAGGIGSGQQIAAALALGCQGAWTGSQWLMVEESSNTPVQQAAYVKAGSRDTVRSRSFTGKPARMLRNDWTEAWEQPENPKPLGMPLQYMVSGMAVRATNRYPNESVEVAFNPVGQVVGQFQKVEKTSTVIERWIQEYLESTTRLDELNAAASV